MRMIRVMETITARFATKCPSCHRPINEGAPIAKGPAGKYVHAACVGGPPASAPPAPKVSRPRRDRASRPAPPAGPEMRNDRDAYAVGDVLTCQLSAREISECEARQSITAIDVTGDKPIKRAGDRRVAVVVVHASRMRQDDADDNGYCGRYGAIVRLATADEAAPLVAARAAKAQAQTDAKAAARAWSTRLAELTEGRLLVEGGSIDRAGEVIHEERKGLHGTVSGRWSRLADGSIQQEIYAYDDERWGRWITVDQLLDLARESTRTLEEAIRGQRYSALDRAIVWLAAQAGKTPRPPVTVTLRGLEQPVTLTVRISSASGLVVAEIQGGGSVKVPMVGGGVHMQYEWAWPVDRLHAQFDAAPHAEAFADLEFAPGVEVASGDRLALPDGLWIEGMRAALAVLGRAAAPPA